MFSHSSPARFYLIDCWHINIIVAVVTRAGLFAEELLARVWKLKILSNLRQLTTTTGASIFNLFEIINFAATPVKRTCIQIKSDIYPQVNFLDLGLESDHRIEESNMHSRLACTFALHNHRFQCHGRPSKIIRRPKHMSEDKFVSKMSSSMIFIKI